MKKIFGIFLLTIIVFCSKTAFAENITFQMPKLIKIASLEYPEKAIAAGIEGKVDLEILVKADGTVGNVVVINSSGNELLDESAIKHAYGYVFEPAKDSDGKALEAVVCKTVTFKIEKGKKQKRNEDYEKYISQFKSLPKFKHKPKFIVPDELKSSNAEFRALVRFFIQKDGKVQTAIIVKSSGVHSFDEAVIQNALKCTFTPAIDQNGNNATFTAVKRFIYKKNAFVRNWH